jgi:hypothetical protein
LGSCHLPNTGVQAPANWRAEQAIRPAVVNRNVWGGNRTDTRATAQSILMSVLRTCARLKRNSLTFLSRLRRLGGPSFAKAKGGATMIEGNRCIRAIDILHWVSGFGAAMGVFRV